MTIDNKSTFPKRESLGSQESLLLPNQMLSLDEILQSDAQSYKNENIKSKNNTNIRYD